MDYWPVKIERLKGEWQIAHEPIEEIISSSVNDEIEGALSWSINNNGELPSSLTHNSRYIVKDTSGELSITPILADRSVISRPITPFNLTAGEQVTLYISSQLWLEVSVNTPQKKVLTTIPIQRPSDTWFGPSTLAGELCYASNTHCRLHLSELPQRPHRALTPVAIHNLADTNLLVERINLPVPLLQLFTCEKGQLWTPKVTMTRAKDGDMANLEIGHKPPAEAAQAKLLNQPRVTTNYNVLFRAFNAVFN